MKHSLYVESAKTDAAADCFYETEEECWAAAIKFLKEGWIVRYDYLEKHD